VFFLTLLDEKAALPSVSDYPGVNKEAKMRMEAELDLSWESESVCDPSERFSIVAKQAPVRCDDLFLTSIVVKAKKRHLPRGKLYGEVDDADWFIVNPEAFQRYFSRKAGIEEDPEGSLNAEETDAKIEDIKKGRLSTKERVNPAASVAFKTNRGGDAMKKRTSATAAKTPPPPAPKKKVLPPTKRATAVPEVIKKAPSQPQKKKEVISNPKPPIRKKVISRKATPVPSASHSEEEEVEGGEGKNRKGGNDFDLANSKIVAPKKPAVPRPQSSQKGDRGGRTPPSKRSYPSEGPETREGEKEEEEEEGKEGGAGAGEEVPRPSKRTKVTDRGAPPSPPPRTEEEMEIITNLYARLDEVAKLAERNQQTMEMLLEQRSDKKSEESPPPATCPRCLEGDTTFREKILAEIQEVRKDHAASLDSARTMFLETKNALAEHSKETSESLQKLASLIKSVSENLPKPAPVPSLFNQNHHVAPTSPSTPLPSQFLSTGESPTKNGSNNDGRNIHNNNNNNNNYHNGGNNNSLNNGRLEGQKQHHHQPGQSFANSKPTEMPSLSVFGGVPTFSHSNLPSSVPASALPTTKTATTLTVRTTPRRAHSPPGSVRHQNEETRDKMRETAPAKSSITQDTNTERLIAALDSLPQGQRGSSL